jgi:hypothetical protein
MVKEGKRRTRKKYIKAETNSETKRNKEIEVVKMICAE